MSDFDYPPSVARVKSYLRIETTVDDELILDLISEVDSLITNWLGAPVVVTQFTDIDLATTERNYVPPMSMTFKVRPVVIAPGTFGDVTDAVAPVITDVDGTVVEPDTYIIDTRTGVLQIMPDAIALTGAPFFFDNGPYTLVYWAGYQCHPEYALRMDAMLRRAAIDWIGDLYTRRTPAAKSESAGGGVSVAWDNSCAVPSRVRGMLAGIRHVQIAP